MHIIYAYVYIFRRLAYMCMCLCVYVRQWNENGAKKGGKMDEIAKQNSPPALQEAFTDYSRYIDAGENTLRTYTGNLRQFAKWLYASGIDQPQREDILAYKEDLKSRLKPSTVQNYITALRLFFSWTAQRGIYPNIADHIKGAKLDSAHKKDYLTSAQAKDLLHSIERKTARGKRDFAIISLMLTCGLRDIEVSRADTSDLRQIGDTTVLYIQGKGREDRTEYVKVVPKVEKALREYLKTRKKGQKALFTSLSNNNKGGRLTARSISGIVKQRLVSAGYDSERLTAHSLRHTAVTLSLIGGLPLDEVQQFARHHNIATTQIYAHNLERLKNRSEETIANSIFN